MRIAFTLVLSSLCCFGQILTRSPILESTSSLRNGLVGYWRLEEASGTRYDCSKNGNHLTSNNSVGQGTGIQQNCSTFNSASSQRLSLTTTQLGGGSSDFTVCGWFFMTTYPGGSPVMISKSTKWYAYFNGSALQMNFRPTATTPFCNVTVASPLTNAWHFIACGMYTTATTNAFFSIDNGTKSTTTFSGYTSTGSASFEIGSLTAANFFTGSIDECGYWNRKLTDTEITQLYNSGLGTHFPWAHP